MTSTAMPAAGGVWAELVGQESVVGAMRRAVGEGGRAMSHAWLITGPPGSGRSNAARAFAAALQCEPAASQSGTDRGCGHCPACRTALTGAHPDVTLVRTEQLSIGVDEVRELVRKAAMSPTTGRHQVLVVEDADRVTERGADALLKAIEEPAPRTVWLLCAPTPEDVVVTIRSRCRQVRLSTPSEQAVATLLMQRDGIDEPVAAWAARLSQGHIGRARALARSEPARNRRKEVLRIPGALASVGECLSAARDLELAAGEEAAEIVAPLDERERRELSEALGQGTRGAKARNAQAVLKELDDQHKARAKRLKRDALDRVLTELTTWYRDVLALQTSPPGSDPSAVRLINIDLADELGTAARGSSPVQVVRCLDALLECREALAANVAPLLAMEALLLTLAEHSPRPSPHR